MAILDFKDFEVIVREILDPEIVDLFEQETNLYKKFNEQKDVHTWLTSLRDMSRMLEGVIKLPHTVYEMLNIIDDLGNLKYNEPKYITVSECDVCAKAYLLRKKYKEEKQTI